MRGLRPISPSTTTKTTLSFFCLNCAKNSLNSVRIKINANIVQIMTSFKSFRKNIVFLNLHLKFILLIKNNEFQMLDHGILVLVSTKISYDCLKLNIYLVRKQLVCLV